MARVLGIGGVFFKSKDTGALINWYRDVIGLELQDWGGVVFRPEAMVAHPGAATVFSPFGDDTTYFEPSTKDFMINLAVDDLDGILASCARHGVEANMMPDEPMAGSPTSSTRKGRRSSCGSRSRCRTDGPVSLGDVRGHRLAHWTSSFCIAQRAAAARVDTWIFV